MSKRAPLTILIAEDNAADVMLVRRALRNHSVDCDLHVMRDGAEAIRWLTKLDETPNGNALDLILLDMHLPKHDGEDILKRLRSSEHYAQTPVIVMTSQDSTTVEGLALKHAALFYFRKSSSLDEFMQLGSIVKGILADDPSAGVAPPAANKSGGQP
jgi:CheY-like chemotaxis protein